MRIQVSKYESVELGSEPRIAVPSFDYGDYSIVKDEKWLKFIKDHGFKRMNDVPRKWYDLYLLMCAEGML